MVFQPVNVVERLGDVAELDRDSSYAHAALHQAVLLIKVLDNSWYILPAWSGLSLIQRSMRKKNAAFFGVLQRLGGVPAIS